MEEDSKTTKALFGAFVGSFVGMPEEAIPSSQASGENVGDEISLLPSRPLMALLLSRFLNKSFLNDESTKSTEKDDDDDDGKNNDDDEENAMIESQTIESISANTNDPYQHFAAILMNATQVEQGRKFVMKLNSNG